METKSIASNHLSQAANKGRYGDDVLVHMNRNEVKSLANMAGLDDLPRNPETGLPEAWIFAAASLATSLYQGAKATEMGRDNAGTQLSLMRSQKENLKDQKESLGQTVGAQKQAASAQFEQNLEQLSMKTGTDKEDILEGYDKTMQQSGLTSSSAAEGKEKLWNRVNQTFSTAQDSLLNDFSKMVGDAEGYMESETARIESEEKRLAAEENILKRQSNERFLGIW